MASNMIKTRPLENGASGTCDWGYCDNEAVAERATGDPCMPWLPVCDRHTGSHTWQGHKTARGRCRACGRSYALSVKDGVVPLHNAAGMGRCSGSRQLPNETGTP